MVELCLGTVFSPFCGDIFRNARSTKGLGGPFLTSQILILPFDREYRENGKSQRYIRA